MSTRLLRWLPGKAGDHQYAFCSILGSLRTHRLMLMLQGLLWRFDNVCCDSYRGRLRTINVFWWLHGFVCWWVGLGHNSCCDGFRGRLRITRVLW